MVGGWLYHAPILTFSIEVILYPQNIQYPGINTKKNHERLLLISTSVKPSS